MEGIFFGRSREPPQEILDLLEPDEKVLQSYEQSELYMKDIFGGPESIYITDRRIFKLVPTTLGLRKKVQDYRYEDMANVYIQQGIIMADIAIRMRYLSNDVSIKAIPKEGAKEIVKTIQDGIAGRLYSEPSMQHKSEKRVITSDTKDIPEQIKKLADLKNEGILTEEEFQDKKTILLKKL